MLADISKNTDSTAEPSPSVQLPSSASAGCSPASSEASCCRCRELNRQLSLRQGPCEPIPIGQVLLVFFLPLGCAAALVIWAVRSSSFLAVHPGYLALAALAVAGGALGLAKLLTRSSDRQVKDN